MPSPGRSISVPVSGRDEDGNAIVLTKDYIITHKFNKWREYYLDKDNKKTYLNATQSALKAYNCTYDSARTIGWENAAKLDNIGRAIGENLGLTPDKFIQLAWKKAIETDKPDYWDRALKAVGWYEKLNQRDPSKFEGLEVKTDKDGETSIKIVKYGEDDE